jgi:hypothetical protein
MAWTGPTTAVLDNFNRAGPGLGTNWSVLNGASAASIISSTVVQVNTGSSYSEMWWNPTTFTGEAEVYLTVPTISTVAGNQIYLDIFTGWSTSSLAALNGYQMLFTRGATDAIKLAKYTTGTGTDFVGSSTNLGTNLAAGDQLAFTKQAGGSLTGWAKQGAGAWTAITNVTDTTYFNSGQTYNIGWGGFGTTYRFDDFGGGTIVSGGVTTRQTLSLLGVGS